MLTLFVTGLFYFVCVFSCCTLLIITRTSLITTMARNLCSFDRVCMIELYLILRNGFVYVGFLDYIGFYATFLYK